jgi:plasmid maintenance system antidote protein VapI
VRRATLSDLLHGKSALTPAMALRIEKAFGPDMNHFCACSSPTMWRKHGSTRGTSRSNAMSQPEGSFHDLKRLKLIR